MPTPRHHTHRPQQAVTRPTPTASPVEAPPSFWSTVAAISDTFIAANTDRQVNRDDHKALAMALSEMPYKLALTRGITLEWSDAIAIYRELVTCRTYTASMLEVALLWIYDGDWQYKTPKRLTVKDFYPTAEQLQTTRRRFVTLEKHRADLRKAVEVAREEGRIEGERMAEQRIQERPCLTQEQFVEYSRKKDEHHAEILELLHVKADTIAALEAAQQQNEKLQHRLDQCRSELQSLRAENALLTGGTPR